MLSREDALKKRPAASAAAEVIRYTSMPSPVGTLWIAVGTKGLKRVSFDVDELMFTHELSAYDPGLQEYTGDGLKDYVRKFNEYFSGQRRRFEMRLDLDRVTPFHRSVLEQVLKIPYGEVRSYGDVARRLGKPRASRAVGTAVATNPISIVIPCHRVVRSDGLIGDYGRRSFGLRGTEYKRMLLAMEGVALQGA